MAAIDFYTDPLTGDIEIENGDLKLGLGDHAHVGDILISNPGHYKQWPIVGVGIVRYLKSPSGSKIAVDFERNVRIQLTYDKMIIQSFMIDSVAGVKINATRND